MRTMSYYITRSGALKQQYVLWVETHICWGVYNVNTVRGICNLGTSELTAVRNAEARLGIKIGAPVTRSGTKKTLNICETRKRDIESLTAFGADFHATKKGYMAPTTCKFWAAWKEDRLAVKSSGFSCFKLGTGFQMFISREQIESKGHNF